MDGAAAGSRWGCGSGGAAAGELDDESGEVEDDEEGGESARTEEGEETVVGDGSGGVGVVVVGLEEAGEKDVCMSVYYWGGSRQLRKGVGG